MKNENFGLKLKQGCISVSQKCNATVKTKLTVGFNIEKKICNYSKFYIFEVFCNYSITPVRASLHLLFFHF